MKERPILFIGPMVQAILAGRKIQTRRAVKIPAGHEFRSLARFSLNDCNTPPFGLFAMTDDGHGNGAAIRCPYSDGTQGDRLWVRETTRARRMRHILTGEELDAMAAEYVADGEPVIDKHEFDIVWWCSRKTCPAIHMPRWACRITLEITEVRVERLQEISEEDARAEGIEQAELRGGYVYHFEHLWDSINGEKHPWASNPWVWVVSFTRV